MNFSASYWQKHVRLLHLLILIPVTLQIAPFTLNELLFESLSLRGMISKVLLITGMVGIYCYIFKAAFLHPFFWRFILTIDFLDNTYMLYDSLIQARSFIDQIGTLNAIVVFLLCLYYYWLLWLFSFESKDIWHKKYNNHPS